jgi:hypothetical protein
MVSVSLTNLLVKYCWQNDTHATLLLLLTLASTRSSHLRLLCLLLVTPLSTSLYLLRDVSTPRNGGQSSFTNVFGKGLQDSIQVFLDDCRPAMEILVSKAGDIPFMPSWTPGSSMDPDLPDHIFRLTYRKIKVAYRLCYFMIWGMRRATWIACRPHSWYIF